MVFGKRRAGIAGVAVVALLGLGVVLWSPRVETETVGPVGPPYRVDFAGLDTRQAAEWLVRNHPDYFRRGEGEPHAEWEDSLPEEARVLVRSLVHELIRRWVEDRAAEEATADGLRADTELVRELFLNQRHIDGAPEIDHYYAHDGDPNFSHVALARLLRGVTNCDGQSHILELMVATRHPGTAPQNLPEGHMLVMVPPGQVAPGKVLLDPHSGFPPFYLDPQGRDRSHEGVPSYARLERVGVPLRAGDVFEAPLEPRAWYAMSGKPPTKPLRKAVASPPGGDLVIPADGGRLDPEDRFEAYMDARLEHLFGDRRVARSRYAGVVAKHCTPESQPERIDPDGWICFAARRFMGFRVGPTTLQARLH